MTKHTPRPRLLRNARALRRADEIVDAAARVFSERGYHGTSTQAIADVLGMKQASLYYYFPSKEAALELVCERGVDGFLERAQSITSGPEAPIVRLQKLIHAHLHPVVARADYVRVFINERRYLPKQARQRIARKSHGIERCFAETLQAGVADGSMRADLDVRQAMLLILGMCNSAINWPEADRGDIERTAAHIAGIAASGLQAAGKG